MTERKKIIIREIEYWKKNRLLPEQYCDYLLTLYSGGAEIEQREENTKNKMKPFLFWSYLYLLIGLLPITFLVIYFTELSIVLQMALFSFFLVITGGTTYFLKFRENNFFHIPLIISLMLLFLISFSYTNNADLNSFIPLIVSFINFIVWFLTARYLKVTYLLVGSFLGIVALAIYFFI
jgi:hypothetical protein